MGSHSFYPQYVTRSSDVGINHQQKCRVWVGLHCNSHCTAACSPASIAYVLLNVLRAFPSPSFKEPSSASVWVASALPLFSPAVLLSPVLSYPALLLAVQSRDPAPNLSRSTPFPFLFLLPVYTI